MTSATLNKFELKINWFAWAFDTLTAIRTLLCSVIKFTVPPRFANCGISDLTILDGGEIRVTFHDNFPAFDSFTLDGLIQHISKWVFPQDADNEWRLIPGK